jgi:hypothetical protein
MRLGDPGRPHAATDFAAIRIVFSKLNDRKKGPSSDDSGLFLIWRTQCCIDCVVDGTLRRKVIANRTRPTVGRWLRRLSRSEPECERGGCPVHPPAYA